MQSVSLTPLGRAFSARENRVDFKELQTQKVTAVVVSVNTLPSAAVLGARAGFPPAGTQGCHLYSSPHPDGSEHSFVCLVCCQEHCLCFVSEASLPGSFNFICFKLLLET